MKYARLSMTQLSVCFWLAVSMFFVTTPAAAETAVWTNARTTENWSDPNNWDIHRVPLNGLTAFDVIIPAGFSVYYDVDEPGFITDLDLAFGSTLIVEPGHSLTLLDDAVLDGTVRVDGAAADLIAVAPGAALGNGARLAAANGGTIECAAAAYASTGLNDHATLFSADGYGSRLGLASLQSLDARFTATYRTHTISAANLGVVDLSEVGTLYGANSSTSLLNIHIGSGGFINFYYLTDILGGYTKFDLDIPYYTLPSLETALQTTFDVSPVTLLSMPALHTVDRCAFVIPDGGMVNAPVLTNLLGSQVNLNPSRVFICGPLQNIDNSRIALTGGLEFGTATGEITAAAYASTGLGDNVTLFSASGAGTRLDLSSIELFDARFAANYRTQTVSAEDNAAVDLSSVTTLYGSASSLSRLQFTIGVGGHIDLSSLQEIPAGYTTFDVDIPSYTLPSLQSAFGTTFDASNVTTINLPVLTSLANSALTLANEATVNAPSLTSFTNSAAALNPSRTFVTGGLSTIDNSRFILTEGAQFGTAWGDITATAYASTGLGDNITLFSATGPGTLLDLSSVEILNAGFAANYRTQTIAASDSGWVDLSSVSTLHGSSSSLSRLKFVVDTGGGIDLAALRDIPSGYTTFDIDIPLYAMPALETASGVTFDASAVATIELPELTTLDHAALVMADGATVNAPKLTAFTMGTLDLNPSRTFINGTLTNIDNTRITLSGGIEFGVATGDVDVTSYTSTALNDNYTVFSVDGEGTVLDLSTLQSINAAFTANYRTQTFSVTDKAVLDLSGLGSIAGAASSHSRTRFAVDSGAQILFGDLNISNYTELAVNGTGSQISTDGTFALNAPARLLMTDGAALNLGGDFTYTLTNAADFNLDAAVVRCATPDPAQLEVAGTNYGLGGTDSGNFGIGQLVVGSGLQPTKLMLVDWVDNAGDGPNNEALYLYGSGGMAGLRIRPDSTLIIGDIDVYAYADGGMMHINSLFTDGVKWIPFDEGTITLADYDCTLAADLTGDCIVDLADMAVLAAEWLLNGDLPGS